MRAERTKAERDAEHARVHMAEAEQGYPSMKRRDRFSRDLVTNGRISVEFGEHLLLHVRSASDDYVDVPISDADAVALAVILLDAAGYITQAGNLADELGVKR